jgi:hypothetical protein
MRGLGVVMVWLVLVWSYLGLGILCDASFVVAFDHLVRQKLVRFWLIVASSNHTEFR